MTIQLNQNVDLHVIPNRKYKTVRILIRFATPLEEKVSSKRSLLASLLEKSSLDYPNQVAMSRKLADLYGAGFYSTVSRTGNLHYLTVGLNIINDNMVPNGVSVLDESVEFLKQIIFRPHIINNAFEIEGFEREKNNLIADIESIFDDKQSHANLSLQNLFFSNSINQRTPSFGEINQIKEQTAESIAEYYNHMIQNDKIDILVSGDIDPDYVKRCFKYFGFQDRMTQDYDIFYQQPVQNIIQQKRESLPVTQSKLNLAYHCDIYYYDTLYFALLVFNGLFGGFPHSKLFLNVREKHSLAYYASSSSDPFRGLLTVQTGIDGKHRDQVLRLINEQLKEMVAGDFSDEYLEQTKKMLINHYQLSLDNQKANLEQAYLYLQIPDANISQEEWIDRISSVTKKDVQSVASHVKLQAVYFMEGE